MAESSISEVPANGKSHPQFGMDIGLAGMKAAATALSDTSNDAASIINFEMPYVVRATIEGTAPFLFHRWSVDAVEAKAKAAKGSQAKKQDDVESYVYRTPAGDLAIPTEYIRMAMVGAAKFKQDPRSPRKSAVDLFKAGLAGLTDLCGVGKKNWDYIDRRRVRIQQSAITRCRPALLSGWNATFELQILLPEYINKQLVNEVLQSAGRLVGVGDFRPTFGRFQIVSFKVV